MCCDRVQVYDGANESAPPLGTFTGHTIPMVLFSTNNSLFVSFQTDSSDTRAGFLINYTTVESRPTICNGVPTEMNETYGTFGVLASRYRNDLYCQWQISVEIGKRVLLHFEQFDVQYDKNCFLDNVTVTDSVTGDQLYTFCGSNLPGDVISSSNQLLIVFVTDSSVTNYGFMIKYTAWTTIPVSEACGQPSVPPQFPLIVGGTEAKEHSWPWQISIVRLGLGHICGGSILDKRWILTAAHCVEGKKASLLRVVVGEHNCYKSEGTEMVLEVERFFRHPRFVSTQYNNDIALIRLKVSLEYRREVAPVCLPDADISPGTVCVTTGWGLTKGTGDGNVLRQVLAPIVATETCNGTGWWHNHITDAMVCAGYEDGARGACNGDSGGPLVCRSVNGHWTLHGITSWVKRGCKARSRPSVYARVRKFVSWIRQTINNATMSGASCSSETVVLTEREGEFGTEGHPYYNNEKCRWRIETDKGALVQLYFKRFELEASMGSGCHYDRINIYDGSDATAKLMHSLCGSNLPGNVTTTGNTVFVTFTSDNTRVYPGFRISYRNVVSQVEGCRGSAATLTGPEGTFGINKIQYVNNMKCGWKVQVDSSKVVKLEFLGLSVEESSTCAFDKVTVYDGVDDSATRLGRYCGTTLPGEIISNTNSLFVSFESDSSVTNDGFSIKYAAIIDGCRRIAVLTGPEGTFGIDKLQYKNSMTCGWKIQVEYSKVVKLEFLTLNVEQSSTCSYDKVTVYDGGWLPYKVFGYCKLKRRERKRDCTSNHPMQRELVTSNVVLPSNEKPAFVAAVVNPVDFYVQLTEKEADFAELMTSFAGTYNSPGSDRHVLIDPKRGGTGCMRRSTDAHRLRDIGPEVYVVAEELRYIRPTTTICHTLQSGKT
ncbi:Ovochymase-2 [Lamellibrachia satsuma]|nr:Ovochymase-2 [Lamellibrachia satsuma]